MEAVGAAAAVTAVVELVARVSASARSFTRDVKDARKDMIQVRKDISDLSTVLGMVADDLDHECSPPGDTPQRQQHIVGIANTCGAVLLEIETVLRESRSGLGWATSGKKTVERLRKRLETCKLSLNVALDYTTTVVVHDIKKDSTRIVGDVSAIQRDMTILLAKVDSIEQRALEDQESQDRSTLYDDNFILDRFLNDCRSDALTVLDNIDYQQDQDLEDDIRPEVQVESPPETPEPKPSPTVTSPSPNIRLKNSLGHTCDIPWEQCRTWGHMEEIIKRSYPHDSDQREEIENGRYDLCHEGQVISSESWVDVVGPGLSFDLTLWKRETIKFKDALGRKFSFPWDSVKTWEGIERMIKHAFRHVEVVGPHVEEGHYDLIAPDGEILLPILWEHQIRPDMFISMRMWPMDKHPLPGSEALQTAMEGMWNLLREQQTPLPPPQTPVAPVVQDGPSQHNRSHASTRRVRQSVHLGESSELAKGRHHRRP